MNKIHICQKKNMLEVTFPSVSRHPQHVKTQFMSAMLYPGLIYVNSLSRFIVKILKINFTSFSNNSWDKIEEFRTGNIQA